MEMSGSTRLEFLPTAYFTKTYGNNRADYSFIAGGVVPGIIIVKPDFPENKDDWPFLWERMNMSSILPPAISISSMVQTTC